MRTHDQYRDDLPLYAVGALSPEEAAELQGHIAACSDCRNELSSLQQAAAQIALAVQPVAPAPDLRRRLIAAAERQPSRTPVRIDEQRSVPRLPARSAWFWTPAFAAAVLVIAFAALWNHDQNLQRDNQDLIARLRAADVTAQQARQVMDTLSAADAQHVTLVATGAKPQPEAKTVYSPRQHSLLLLAGNLAPLPAQKTYELWLLPADGSQPVPAGTFKPDAAGSATLVLSQFSGAVPAKGFAVTVENDPGSSTPTLPIILSGAV